MEVVALGKTGLNVSRLSIGTGSNGWNGRSNQTDLGFEALRDLLLFSHEKGVTFWIPRISTEAIRMSRRHFKRFHVRVSRSLQRQPLEREKP